MRRKVVELDTPADAEPDAPTVLPMDPMAPIAALGELDALHAHPLYGDIPGLPPIFSHSTAPLAPEGGE